MNFIFKNFLNKLSNFVTTFAPLSKTIIISFFSNDWLSMELIVFYMIIFRTKYNY